MGFADSTNVTMNNESYDLEKQSSGAEPGLVKLKGIDSQGKYNRRHLNVPAKLISKLTVEEGEVYEVDPAENNPRWYQNLLDAGVEENGIKPVPIEQRTSTQYNELFTVFFTCLLTILAIPTGMLATLEFGLDLRDASLVILFFSLLCCIPPAFMGIAGMETGLRQIVQARYSFGLCLVTIPLLLNAATMTGFALSAAVVAGQVISSLNTDRVSVNVGILVICLASFGVSLLGFRALHFWERWTWIPALIALVITAGCGGKHLYLQSEVVSPSTTPSQVMSYGGLIAGYFITFGGTVSDYSVYHNPKGVSKFKVFMYMYLGFIIPSVPLLILGAAIGGAVPSIPTWSAAYAVTGIGGVMREMLSPAGGFGNFVLIVLALTVVGTNAISVYSVALNLQMLLPFFARIHRVVFVVVTIAVIIPFAMRAAAEWQESLMNFLAVIGYWAGCFDAVLILELAVFRKMDYETYENAIWNVGRKLPPGFAAMGASLMSMGLVIPGMGEPWYTGPIAETTGDIGFLMALAVTSIFYLPFRWLEIRWTGHL
ncbi:permease for cytosine/purines, uracil, thiamine, allantoin-domain-containing protein [Apodospora peruviana]|uniref:Permease for cytosine/purines, uracil, thiamine, allantoin-domain-containing protein n=1 Tax=Apodospora peruviana TaxID=516989 RepID=A0AAE0M444_9PEZI|nr:permease for cytosine/purines, uracil, thiamine, allantoin-domain-containing protein [Apodospora peruviana]